MTAKELFKLKDLSDKEIDILYPSASDDAFMNDSSGLLFTDKPGDPWHDYLTQKSNRYYRETYDDYRKLHSRIRKMIPGRPEIIDDVMTWTSNPVGNKLQSGCLLIAGLMDIVQQYETKSLNDTYVWLVIHESEGHRTCQSQYNNEDDAINAMYCENDGNSNTESVYVNKVRLDGCKDKDAEILLEDSSYAVEEYGN